MSPPKGGYPGKFSVQAGTVRVTGGLVIVLAGKIQIGLPILDGALFEV